MHNQTFLLGVDVGTSSTKVGLFDLNGRIVAHAHESHTIDTPAPNFAEQDPERTWWEEVCRCVRSISRQCPREAGMVGGIASSGLGATLVLVDGGGRALRPAILYGVDGRAEAQIEKLNEIFGTQRILERCGARLSAQSMGPKLLWLKEHEPSNFSRAAAVLGTNTFLARRMTGETVMDTTTAAFYAPFFDYNSKEWNLSALSEVGIPASLLPRIVEPSDVVGSLTEESAEALGLSAGIPVLAGTVDTYAECVGCGVDDPGHGLLVYGTTMTLLAVTGEPRLRETLWNGYHYRPDRATIIGGMATSGALVEWFRALGSPPPTGSGEEGWWSEMDGEARQIPPGSAGLMALPYFMGERTPVDDPNARGVLIGLSLFHRRAHIYRALLEGIAFALRQNIEEFERLGIKPTELVSSGGGTRGELWVQIVSDVTGLSQRVSKDNHAALRGNARMAAEATGMVTSDTRGSWSEPGSRIDPDPEASQRYDTLYPLFKEIYPATASISHTLTRLQRGEAEMER